MPEIVIKDKAYPLRFGMGFLREIDARLKREIEPGVFKNIGFQYTIADLIDGSIPAMEDILLLAAKTETPRLTQKILDEYLEEEDTDIAALREEVIGFLESSNVTKVPLTDLRNLVALAAQIKQ